MLVTYCAKNSFLQISKTCDYVDIVAPHPLTIRSWKRLMQVTDPECLRLISITLILPRGVIQKQRKTDGDA